MLVSAKESQQLQWLVKNHPSIRWRLIGPNIKNPFDSTASDQKLEAYANDKSILMEACQVHGLMDDTLVLKITDLTILKFDTEHPNLNNLSGDDLDSYLKQAGVWKIIDQEFKKLQQSCEEELEVRKGGGAF